MTFQAGQKWRYHAPAEIADSRLIIGALMDFPGGQQIACCAVTGALQRREDGSIERALIPFLPMTIEALAGTVSAPDGAGEVPEEFAAQLQAWSEDTRGLSYFTVPFEGSLERLIGQQMAAIVGEGD
ncbi:MAG: hypothetical protein R3D67_00760 [Hyphomicrobiaceae bacterium]